MSFLERISFLRSFTVFSTPLMSSVILIYNLIELYIKKSQDNVIKNAEVLILFPFYFIVNRRINFVK